MGESSQAPVLLQEERGAQVDRLSALERQVEQNRADIARLKAYVKGLRASYSRFLTSVARIMKEEEAEG